MYTYSLTPPQVLEAVQHRMYVLASYSRREFNSAQSSDTAEVYYPPVWQWDEHADPGAECCAVDQRRK